MGNSILFITDPFDSLKQEKDTSIFIMKEALRRDFEVFQCEMSDLTLKQRLSSQCSQIIKNNDIQLYILFSRRTDQFIIEYLKERFLDQNIIWNGEGNPYLALMKFSKYLICTAHSVSIISESISSTKPVYIFRLPSLKKNNRIEKFITMLLQKNYARLLGEKLEDFTNSYENETFQVARMIEERYNKKA